MPLFLPVLPDFEEVRDATLRALNNHGMGAWGQSGIIWSAGLIHQQPAGLLVDNPSQIPKAINSNSGIPAWRVCKVRRMLVGSDE